MKSPEAGPALQVFGPLLGLDRTFTADQLAAVLVASPGDEGLLSDVHMVRTPLLPPCHMVAGGCCVPEGISQAIACCPPTSAAASEPGT